MHGIDNPQVVEARHAMNTWKRDNIPMAGAAYRQLITAFYKENRLMAGTLALCGAGADLGRLTANVLNVIAERERPRPPSGPPGSRKASGGTGTCTLPPPRSPTRTLRQHSTR